MVHLGCLGNLRVMEQLGGYVMFLDVFKFLLPSLINPQNLSSYWSTADATNCTDIDTIEVSAGTLGRLSSPSRAELVLLKC